jgi:hypothetical protein
MDVSLSRPRVLLILIAILSLSFISCGNRYDLSTERGRRSRIDDANFHLSRGECSAAAEAIDPLYGSVHETDEIRIIKASTYACLARFNMLTFISNLSSDSNYFKAMAKSLASTAGDATRFNFFKAVDVLTRNGSVMNGGDRTKSENGYMVFIQLGVIGAILRNYGSPASDGTQGADLIYDDAANPAGEMSNEDACALAGAYSFISDSYRYSDLTDDNSSSVVNSLNSACVTIGLSSCSVINRDRSLCDGTNQASVRAEGLIGGVNTSW